MIGNGIFCSGLFDADEGALFTETQLTHVMSKVYETPTPTIKYPQHIPPAEEQASPTDASIEIHTYTVTGKAAIIRSISQDWPKVELTNTPQLVRVVSLGAEYDVDFMEMRTARERGINISAKKGLGARKVVDTEQERIAYLGDANDGLTGLLTFPTTPRVMSDISITDPLVTNDVKLQRLNTWARIPRKITANSGYGVTAVLMAEDDYGYLESTPRSDTSDISLMQIFRRNNPTIQFVDWCRYCEGTGINGTNTMLFYVRDPAYVGLHKPQDFEQLIDTETQKIMTISCHQRTGGTVYTEPLSAVVVENL